MTEFSWVYKDVNIDVGFELPPIDHKQYCVECNQVLPEEPYKIINALHFKENFDHCQRVKFQVKIVLVGKMAKPDT